MFYDANKNFIIVVLPIYFFCLIFYGIIILYQYTWTCRNAEAIKRGKFKVSVMYGEMSMVPLEQLTSMVDTVSYEKNSTYLQ